MDIELRDKFLTLWKKYFNNAELPITFYFSDDGSRALPAGNEHLPRCVIGGLAEVRAGKSLYFDAAIPEMRETVPRLYAGNETEF